MSLFNEKKHLYNSDVRLIWITKTPDDKIVEKNWCASSLTITIWNLKKFSLWPRNKICYYVILLFIMTDAFNPPWVFAFGNNFNLHGCFCFIQTIVLHVDFLKTNPMFRVQFRVLISVWKLEQSDFWVVNKLL